MATNFNHLNHSINVNMTLSTLWSCVQSNFAYQCTANFRTAVHNSGTDTCGCEFFWLHPAFNPNPGVPPNQGCVNTMIDVNFTNPAPFPTTVMVAVDSIDEHPVKGQFKALTPPELIHALSCEHLYR